MYNLGSHRHESISNTTSYIEVLELGGDDKDPWAIVKNPYDSKEVTFKLHLGSYNTENPLNVGDTFLATYETNLKTKKIVLTEIKESAKP